jgi:aldehyde:ferredoxin oxidoreductase
MKSDYYELRGWDVESGLPTRAKLEELKLNDVAADLEERGLLK